MPTLLVLPAINVIRDLGLTSFAEPKIGNYHPRFGYHAHAQYEHAYAARKHGTRKFRILPVNFFLWTNP